MPQPDSDPRQRDRGHWQSPLTEAKNIQVACTVGKR